MKLSRIILLGIAAAAGLLFSQAQQLRQWTDATGRKVEAAFSGVQGENVILQLKNGSSVPFAIAKLSPADQDFIKNQAGGPVTNGNGNGGNGSAKPPGAAGGKTRLPIDKRAWPDQIMVSPATIDANLVKENPANREFIYQTQAFEFSSQAKLAKSVMTEVAQSFEITRELLDKLPWGLECRPPDGMERYLAKLFETRDDYQRAGGPELSGGVYSGATKTFMVPFQSIGLKMVGKTYQMDRKNFRNDTLVHEITHQLMDEYIQFLPTWMIEGTAEYCELLPDSANGFYAGNHKTGIKDYIKTFNNRKIDTEIPSLQEHMTMTRPAWDGIATDSTSMGTLYFRSCLLVYYFNHLDGDGKGLRFLRYMDAVHGEVEATREFFKNPEVKRTGGGGFTYPRGLTPPDFRNPFKHLPLLLDERAYDKLAKEIEDGYKGIGVKIKVGGGSASGG